MRKVHYCAAISLDGYIAGPKGEYDWIIADPEIDSAMATEFARFDTALVGRKTFDTMVRENRTEIPGLQVIVFSRTLHPNDYPKCQIVSGKSREFVTALREKPGKEILLLGGGIPLLPPLAAQHRLELSAHKIYKSGIVALDYAVK